ncbi:MAG: hypothetical protein A2103_02540 [Gammaproteobacteria bacterium GWF2_41_13]|nr:MAG: hypothetical protein A2103_02540 [Gammaproteobacteria bacterium GWF2_41_13]
MLRKGRLPQRFKQVIHRFFILMFMRSLFLGLRLCTRQKIISGSDDFIEDAVQQLIRLDVPHAARQP